MFERPANLSEYQVALDSIHLVLKLNIVRIHLSNHVANLTTYGGKDEDTTEKVKGDKKDGRVTSWLRCFTNSRESECTPVEAVHVLLAQNGGSLIKPSCIKLAVARERYPHLIAKVTQYTQPY